MNTTSFSYLFDLYLKRTTLRTLSDFGSALATEGIVYEDSMFSKWKSGDRVPRNRKLLVVILRVLVSYGGIGNISEANSLLYSTDQRSLNLEETAYVEGTRRITGSRTFCINLDGVISDLESSFLSQWHKKYPARDYIETGSRKSFYVFNDYPSYYLDDIRDIFLSEGFFRKLSLIEGAMRSLNEMKAGGYKIFIYTRLVDNLSNTSYIMADKYEWVKLNLGSYWADRLIFCSDKTFLHCDYLIDDQPEIQGINEPSWKHILYTQPYNKDFSQVTTSWKNILESEFFR